jgi:hypothetical protein
MAQSAGSLSSASGAASAGSAGTARGARGARAPEVVVGVFRARADAERALEALRDAGFAGDSVSILTQNPDGGPAGGLPGSTPTGGHFSGRAGEPADAPAAGTAATTGAVAGGVLGGVAGWLLAAGALVIPGVGPFLAAGALGAALAGAAVGAGLGAIAGALGTLGIPEEEARWYEEEVRGGGTLVTVGAGGRFDEARRILRDHGAYDVDSRDPEQVGYGVAGGSSTMRDAPATSDATIDRLAAEARLHSIRDPQERPE